MLFQTNIDRHQQHIKYKHGHDNEAGANAGET